MVQNRKNASCSFVVVATFTGRLGAAESLQSRHRSWCWGCLGSDVTGWNGGMNVVFRAHPCFLSCHGQSFCRLQI